MSRPYDVITFDCYGTLIDWESGIADAFIRAAREDGIELRAEDVLRIYEIVERVVEREEYRLYRDVLTEAATRVAHALGWALAYERGTFLVSTISDWKPFADTNAALRKLHDAGYRLGILSNVDDDLLAATLRRIEVAFDLIVTAEQVRSYKPAPGHFEKAKRLIGEARWLHAAQSVYHDVRPASELGIEAAWVNRRSHARSAGIEPKLEVADLAQLAAKLT